MYLHHIKPQPLSVYKIKIMGSIFSSELSIGNIQVIFLEGNIGSGKTSILNYLETIGEVTVPEAVDEWRFLEHFYSNKSCGFQLQTEIALSMNKQFELGIRKAIETKRNRIFVERSIQTCSMFGDGLDTDERCILKKLYDVLTPTSSYEKLGSIQTIYLNIDPRICWERINVRGRVAEKGITQEYVYKMHKVFETHFMNETTVHIRSDMDVEAVGQEILSVI